MSEVKNNRCDFCGKVFLPKGWKNHSGNYCEGRCVSGDDDLAKEVTDEELKAKVEKEMKEAPPQPTRVLVERELQVLPVLKPGEGVVLKGNPHLEVRIIKATVHMSGEVEYLASWWDNNDLLEKWVQRDQIDLDAKPVERLPIGFLNRGE